MATGRFGIAHPTRKTIEQHIAIAPVFGGVHSDYARGVESVHNIFHGIRCQPIMGVHQLEFTNH